MLPRLLLGALIALMLSAGPDARAQTFPTRTITLVVPSGPGSGIDTNARIQALALAEVLDVGIVVENVGGAGGTIGAARAAKAAPDGYTLLIGNSGTHAYSPALYRALPFDPLLDFEPVGIMTQSPRILVVRQDLPVDNLQQFIAYARANQGNMLYASAGVGSGTHLPCALLNTRLGISVMHVAYRGTASAMQDLVGRRIDYMCDAIQSSGDQIRAGHVKGIAALTPTRVPSLPDLATSSEQGLPGVEASVWNGFFYPRGTPRDIVLSMNAALNAMIERPEIVRRMRELGLEILPPSQRTPESMARFLSNDIERWGKVIRAAGLEGIAGN